MAKQSDVKEKKVETNSGWTTKGGVIDSDDRPVTRAEFNNLEAYVRTKFADIGANWKRFCRLHVGHDEDGKIGLVRQGLLGLVSVIGIVGVGVLVAFAGDSIIDHKGPGLTGAGFRITDSTGIGILEMYGYEACDARLMLDADQGDNDADTWFIESEAADNDLSFVNHTTELMKLDTSGNLTVIGGMTLTDLTLSDTSPTLILTNTANNGTADIRLHADKEDDAGDGGGIQKQADGVLAIRSDDLTKGTLHTIWSWAKDGIVTMTNGCTLDNSTSSSTLTITETTVDIAGALTANSLAIDAGAGVDAGSAGALYFGATTATSVEISKSGVGTTVNGTFTVDETSTFTGVATFAADPLITGSDLRITNGTDGAVCTIQMFSDKNDDLSDTFIVSAGNGTANFQFDSGTKGTGVTKASLNSSGIWTLVNGELIDNSSDGSIYLTFDDDNAQLGSIILRSDNATGNMANSDQMSIVMQAYDDNTNMTYWAYVDTKITDVANASKDSSVVLRSFVANTLRTVANFGAATTIGTGNETVAIDSSDWDINATGDMTGIGAITANGAVDLQSTLDVDGEMTCTNLTVDGGAKIVGGASCVITNMELQGCVIGSTAPASGGFTTLSASGTSQLGAVVTMNARQAVGLMPNAGGGIVGSEKAFLFCTNVTMHSGTVWTQTLAFTSAILAVHVTPTEVTTTVPAATSVATNEVQITVEADKNFYLTVIGTDS